MKTGVYQILNLKNNKFYIGSTGSKAGFIKRWNDHQLLLKKNCHHSVHLQRAWDKYEVDAFVFEVIEYIVRLDEMTDKEWKTLIFQREQYYLDVFLFASDNDNRFHKLGYNICRVAGSTLGLKLELSEDNLNLRRAQGSALGKLNTKLARLDVLAILNDLFIHQISVSDLIIKYQISQSSIMDIKHNRTWQDIDRSIYQTLPNPPRQKLSALTKQRMSFAKRGEGTHLSKLTESKVIEIKAMIQQGLDNHKIAARFNVDHSNISKIRTGKTWRHINDESKIAIPRQTDDNCGHERKNSSCFISRIGRGR